MTMLSPMSTQNNLVERFTWQEFVSTVARYPFSYAGQRLAYMAQCILESGVGTSRLYRLAGNPTGLKWREEMADIATPLSLVTPTEPQGVTWCSWAQPQGAIDGYRRFIQRDRYQGWETFGNDPMGYIRHIVSCGYATDPNYISKIEKLLPQARELLEASWIQAGSADGSMSQVDEILVDLSPNKELIIYAMAGNQKISSLKSSAKAEVFYFLSRHGTASRIKASPAIKAIDDQDLQRLTSSNSDAKWLQFWQSNDGKITLLGMVNGTAVSAVKSEEPAAILKFFSNNPAANTIQAANSESTLIWNQFERADNSLNLDPDHGHDDNQNHDGHSSSSASLRPYIQWVDGCRNFSSRNGQSIDAIVLHYTTSRSVDGAIAWFMTSSGEKAVSAHYIVGLDGAIIQLVKDSDKAWHCYGFNTSSIGIEHVAQAGDKLTQAQEQASAALLRWLIAEYRVSPQRIYGHKWNPVSPGGTPCPGDLWLSPEELQNWVQSVVVKGAPSSLISTSPADHPTPSESLRRPYSPITGIDWNDMNSRVSRYFTVAEVTQKDRRRIPAANSQEQKNILLLASELDRVRDAWGKPIGVTSWYRPVDINLSVGGVFDSQHILGLAADIYTMDSDGSSARDREFENWLDKIAWNDRALGLGVRSGRGFTHVDLRTGLIRWDYA